MVVFGQDVGIVMIGPLYYTPLRWPCIPYAIVHMRSLDARC